MFSCRIAMALLAALVLSISSALAHPFHTSTAELDWNPDTKRWEISLRVHAGDLEQALSQRYGKKIDIESREGEKLIQEYLSTRFLFLPQTAAKEIKQQTAIHEALAETAKAQVARLTWHGQELEGNWLWLYFELSQPDSSEQLVLLSQLLTEINDDQINILSMRQSGKRVTRQTTRSQMWIALQ